jgi:hypothetical protein
MPLILPTIVVFLFLVVFLSLIVFLSPVPLLSALLLYLLDIHIEDQFH